MINDMDEFEKRVSQISHREAYMSAEMSLKKHKLSHQRRNLHAWLHNGTRVAYWSYAPF